MEIFNKQEVMEKINSIDEKIEENHLSDDDLTRMMFEKMLIGLRLNNF